MKEVVTFILNIGVTCLVAFLLNLNFLEKRRYQKLNTLNAELDILLKVFELEHKGIPIPYHIQRYIKERYETTKRRNKR